MRKLLKFVGLVLLTLIALVLIIAAFVPTEKTYGASTIISQPIETVYAYVQQLDNQKKYSYFFLEDPNITTTSTGTDGTVGYVQSWKSKKMGDGTQTIQTLEQNKSITTLLDFGMGDPAVSKIELVPNGTNATEVTYQVHMKSVYPINIVFLVMNMDFAFEQSLHNLKRILENK